jgi:hypothetical protein
MNNNSPFKMLQAFALCLLAGFLTGLAARRPTKEKEDEHESRQPGQ